MDLWLLVVVTFLHGGSAGGAIALARRSPAYRPIAYLLTGSLITELGRWANREGVLKGAARPLIGIHRGAGHLEQALYLAWPAGVLGVTWWALRRSDRWGRPPGMLLVPLGYAAILGYLAWNYPAIRGDRLAAAYGWIHLGEVLALAAVWGWYLLRMRQSPDWPGPLQRAGALLFMSELALFGGPFFLARSPFRDADLSAVVYGLLYTSLGIMQWRSLCRLPGIGRRIGS